MRRVAVLICIFIASNDISAANLTMYSLAGAWTAKKQIIENGKINLDASGNPSTRKVTVTQGCEIAATTATYGTLNCGDDYFQVSVSGKKLRMSPLAYPPYNGFIQTLKQAWLDRNRRVYESSSSSITSSIDELELSGSVVPNKVVPLNIVNKKKMANGAIRLSASFTGEYCTTFRDRFGRITLVKCEPLTAGATYEVKYLSLTR